MAWNHAGNRHARGYGRRWEQLRDHIMRRDTRLCQPCLRADKLTPATQVDHIKPKAQGGTDDPDNLQAICDSCHTAKTQAEAKQAQHGQRPTIGADGWPIS